VVVVVEEVGEEDDEYCAPEHKFVFVGVVLPVVFLVQFCY
jgi:hypothetical protein